MWQKEGKLEASTDPELWRLDLTDLAMNAALCQQDVYSLKFVDDPPEFALKAAVGCLKRWGLVDDQGVCVHKDELELPLPIELSRLIPLAPPEVLPDWLDLCALLESRGSLFDGRASEAAIEQRAVDFPGCRLLASLRALRTGDAQRHGLQAEVLAQARELAGRLRSMLGLGPLGGTLRPDALAGFLARCWPERVFVKRAKREVFANGHSEATVERHEGLSDDTRAAILLEVQPISQRGLQVQLKARWALPCSLAVLRAAGVGEVELDGVKHNGRRVVGELVRRHADVELAREEVELEGAHLREGLCQLLVRGSLWREAMLKLEEDHRLARLESGSLLPWRENLLERLRVLGLESPEDIELIGPGDLATASLDETTRARLKSLYPATFSSGVAVYSVDYDPSARRVTLCWKSGTKNAPVPLALLPRWNGWAAQVNERGRLTPLRG